METHIIEKQYNIILPMLDQFLSHSSQKIVYQALNSLNMYFTSVLAKEINIETTVVPYVSSLVGSIYNILGITPLLNQALSTLSLLITCAGGKFLPYCNKFYSGLRIILNSPCNNILDQEIRAECIRCIGCLVENMTDISEVSGLFNEILSIKSIIPEEDLSMAAIWDILPQFAMSLKQNFSSYLEIIIPELIYRLQLDIDIHLSDNDNTLPGYDIIRLNIPGHGEKAIAINTIKLQAKIKASETFYNLFKTLKNSLSP